MKIAVITGASSGMGREFVRQLTSEEAFDEVWVIARREERLLELKEEMGDFIRPIPLDLQNTEDLLKYKKLLEEKAPDIAVYGATKAYVLSFTRAVNAELRHTGIKMMAVCPGWVKTEFFDRAVVDNDVITYYNKFFTAKQVVKRALRDMKRGKDVSIVGFSIRAQVVLTKLLPHKLVMKIWLKQQKKK